MTKMEKYWGTQSAGLFPAIINCWFVHGFGKTFCYDKKLGLNEPPKILWVYSSLIVHQVGNSDLVKISKFHNHNFKCSSISSRIDYVNNSHLSLLTHLIIIIIPLLMGLKHFKGSFGYQYTYVDIRAHG